VGRVTFLDVYGGRIYFEVAGPSGAPALLFLHAGVATSAMWTPQWDDLARDHRMVRYDLRGFGRTESQDVEFSDRADAIAVLDAAGIERATLIGASRGGGIAIDTAVEYPARVGGVVAVGSAASGMPRGASTADEERIDAEIDAFSAAGDPEAALRREVELWWVGPRRLPGDVDPAFLEFAYADNLANLPREGEQARPIRLDPSAWERLPELGIPMLFAVGDEDLAGEVANARTLAEALPDAEHHVFAGAAHIPNVEKPDEFARVLRDFLARHGL
jgi:pimeloyl-ACP methyl ester carboxylesterase